MSTDGLRTELLKLRDAVRTHRWTKASHDEYDEELYARVPFEKTDDA